MHRSPQRCRQSPAYPSTSAYEHMRGACLGIAAVVGVVAGVRGIIQEASAAEKTAPTGDEKADTNKIQTTIKVLISQLGHKESKVRQEATIKLIELGKKKDEDGASAYRKEVLAAVTPLLKSSDPEVMTRAKAIVKALTAEKKPARKEFEGRLPGW